jgi:hypothetical protein
MACRRLGLAQDRIPFFSGWYAIFSRSSSRLAYSCPFSSGGAGDLVACPLKPPPARIFAGTMATARSTHASRSLIAGPGRIAGRTGALSFLIGLHVRAFAGPAC